MGCFFSRLFSLLLSTPCFMADVPVGPGAAWCRCAGWISKADRRSAMSILWIGSAFRHRRAQYAPQRLRPVPETPQTDRKGLLLSKDRRRHGTDRLSRHPMGAVPLHPHDGRQQPRPTAPAARSVRPETGKGRFEAHGQQPKTQGCCDGERKAVSARRLLQRPVGPAFARRAVLRLPRTSPRGRNTNHLRPPQEAGEIAW